MKSAFAQALGVAESDVTIDYDKKTATVDFDGEVDSEKLAKALKDGGGYSIVE